MKTQSQLIEMTSNNQVTPSSLPTTLSLDGFDFDQWVSQVKPELLAAIKKADKK
jgi:hypothetical protein